MVLYQITNLAFKNVQIQQKKNIETCNPFPKKVAMSAS